jgi:broad specificity phosphatase PhoE
LKKPTSYEDSMLTLHLVRHGEVHNPTGIIYGRLPGFGLSHNGRTQIERAARLLRPRGPYQALYASPLQRAQESAAILAGLLGLEVRTESQIIETGIGQYQGKRFEDLPDPYITEERVHADLESAGEIRARFVAWADQVRALHPGHRIVAVSHRDPIIVALLRWLGKAMDAWTGFELAPGAVYEIRLEDSGSAQVAPVS